MKYISDDGKVFETEQECCEHEQAVQAELSEKEKEWEDVKKKHKAYEEARDDFSKAMVAYERKYPLKNSSVLAFLDKVLEDYYW